jgi:hypothetical protein
VEEAEEETLLRHRVEGAAEEVLLLLEGAAAVAADPPSRVVAEEVGVDHLRRAEVAAVAAAEWLLQYQAVAEGVVAHNFLEAAEAVAEVAAEVAAGHKLS